MKNSYKELTLDEAKAKYEEINKKYFDLRMNMVVGHVENPLEKRSLRRNLARLNTIIREYELGLRKA
ncbi:50S ribosomal protein L29 [Spirochaeta cellobiosiphila]|uniref:50S ribosomal protein L29 n=1 Tax=Spirochaeta cellobiosiphila TaxID=504483 RepID=UPI0003FE4854|nr:50S ribosomal protein L29 [Spirochaeta cellobiosiphila]